MLTVRCPACQAAYQIEEAKLGAGRKLKCAKCGTIWLAVAEPEVVVSSPEPEPEEPVSSTPAAGLNEEQAPEFAPGDEEFINRPPSLDSVVDARPAGWKVWWQRHQWRLSALLVLVGGLAMGVLAVRHHTNENEVVGPQMEVPAEVAPQRVIRPIQPPKGIVLRRVHSEISTTETGVLLTVRGLVTNTTSSSIVVPPLLLQLLDKDGTVQDMWPVSSVAGELPAKEENAWSVSLTEPTLESVRGWRVVFTEPIVAVRAEISASTAGAASGTQAVTESTTK